MKLIGVGGTDGAGKDSLGGYIAEEYGWTFISVTDLLRDEAGRRGMSLSRANLKIISAEWRRESGLGVLIDKAVDAYRKQTHKNRGLIIASLRNPGEADRVHELGGSVIWLDANPQVRYERINSRKRGTEDEVSYEEFLAEEKSQMQHSGDRNTLSLSGVRVKADIFITNDSNDIEEFKRSIGKALAGLI